MRNLEELQSLLFKWLKNYNSRHINQIRAACHGLLRSHNIDDEKITRYCLYRLFYPLLRYGLVEFTGKGNYQTSPPVIFLNRNGSVCQFAAVNLNKAQLKNLQQTIPDFQIDSFQIVRFSASMVTINNFSSKDQIRIQDNRIDCILSQMPTIRAVVSSFKEFYPNSKGFYYFNLDDFEWVRSKNELKPGLYKASAEDYSKRCFLEGDNVWRRIPTLEENPDSVNIARWTQGILEQRKYLCYDQIKKLFICRNICLPILLDRVLRIPSYHLLNGVIQSRGTVIYTNITMNNYKQLNRIFCNTLEVI
jgi:hypothetical protein